MIRHAKAVHDGSADLDRALAPRGLADAAAVGRWLVAQDLASDRVMVSPSLRTRQTWRAISAELGADAVRATVVEQIYDNTVDDLLDVVHDLEPEVSSVAIVGHNPSVHALVLLLAGNAASAAPELATSYPTSAITVLDLDREWSDVGAGDATLRAYAVPRAR